LLFPEAERESLPVIALFLPELVLVVEVEDGLVLFVETLSVPVEVLVPRELMI